MKPDALTFAIATCVVICIVFTLLTMEQWKNFENSYDSENLARYDIYPMKLTYTAIASGLAVMILYTYDELKR